MAVKNLLVSFLVVIFYSCNSQKHDDQFDPEQYINSIKLPAKFSPDNYHDKPIEKGGKKYSQRPDSVSNLLALLLGIDTISSGYNKLQIRVWYGAFGDSVERVLIVKRNAEKWIGEKIFYMPVYWNDSVAKIVKREIIQPEDGWKKLFTSIDELITLPDMKEIEGLDYSIGTDGYNYSVEVASTNYFRKYDYRIPDQHRQFKEVKQFISIVKLLDKEFDMGWSKYVQ